MRTKEITINGGKACLADIPNSSPLDILATTDGLFNTAMNSFQAAAKPIIPLNFVVPSDRTRAADILADAYDSIDAYTRNAVKMFNLIVGSVFSTINDAYTVFVPNHSKQSLLKAPNVVLFMEQIKRECAKSINETTAQATAVGTSAKAVTARLNNTTLIAAPTLSAVLANEVSAGSALRSAHSTQNQLEQEALHVARNGINGIIAYEKSMVNEIPSMLKSIFNESRNEFIQGLLKIQGEASQKDWWRNLQKNPLDISAYVDVLANEKSIDGISELVNYFRIERTSLQSSCISRAKGCLTTLSVSKAQKSLQTFLTNIELLFAIDRHTLYNLVYGETISHIKSQLLRCLNHVPQSAISEVKNGKKLADSAAKCLSAIVSQEDFEVLNLVADGSLSNDIGKAINSNANMSAVQVYSAISSYLKEKLTAASEIISSTNRQIDELTKKKENLTEELAHAGWLEFKKKKSIKSQMVELEERIASTTANCDRQLAEL